MTKTITCMNCHAEMKATDKVTRSQVMKFTIYECPNGCNPFSHAEPLPGHEPVYHVPVEVEPELKPKRKRKAVKVATEHDLETEA